MKNTTAHAQHSLDVTKRKLSLRVICPKVFPILLPIPWIRDEENCWNIKGEAIEGALTMIIDYTCSKVRR